MKWGRASTERKHNVFTHFPKDYDCPICQKRKTMKARCSRKAGESKPNSLRKPTAFGEFISADHAIFNEQSVTVARYCRVDHPGQLHLFAASVSCTTKDYRRELQRFSWAHASWTGCRTCLDRWKRRAHLVPQEAPLAPRHVDSTQDSDKWSYRKGRTEDQGGDICMFDAVWTITGGIWR